jgi:uncharacterized protein (TIGR02145 family)
MNYTITDINYTGVPEGIQVSTIHPTGIMTLTPDPGYTVSAGNFGWSPNNPYVLDVTFSQSGSNVIATVTFDDGFIMEGNNVEIPLCFDKGEAELIYYNVSGQVYAASDANITSLPGDGVDTPFSEISNFNYTATVYIGSFTCDPGYYMPVPPLLTQTSGSSTNFSIAYNDTYDGALLTARQYVITYLFPNYNSSNNNFSIVASSVEIFVPEIGITSYVLGTNSFPPSGGTTSLILYGTPGSKRTLTCASPILQTGPIDPITGIIPYGTTVSGVIDSSGQAPTQILIVITALEAIYSIMLTGDLASSFGQPNPILLYQFGEVTITYSVGSTDPERPEYHFINDGNKFNTGWGLSSPSIGDSGYANDFNWNITPTWGDGLVLVKQPLTTEFNNLDPVLNSGNLLSIDTLLATQTSNSSITLNMTGSVESYGYASMETDLDLSDSIINYNTFVNPSLDPPTEAHVTLDFDNIFTSGEIFGRGFCYGLSPGVTIADSVITGPADFTPWTGVITGLTTLTTYYYKPFVYNCNNELFYGVEGTFATGDYPPDPDLVCAAGWSLANLNVAAYSDGTPIPEVTDPALWGALETGAWCYYDNDPANGAIYGKMYNWYAVAGIHDAASLSNPALRKSLAPTGYHVTTSTESAALIGCLGSFVAGGKMKETGTTHWNAPNTGATNTSGLTFLPGGRLSVPSGPYLVMGNSGYWWTSSESSSILAISYNLQYNTSEVIQGADNKYIVKYVRVKAN